MKTEPTSRVVAPVQRHRQEHQENSFVRINFLLLLRVRERNVLVFLVLHRVKGTRNFWLCDEERSEQDRPAAAL